MSTISSVSNNITVPSSFRSQGATLSSVKSGSNRTAGASLGGAVFVPTKAMASSGAYKPAGTTLSSLKSQSQSNTGTQRAGTTLQSLSSVSTTKSQGGTIGSISTSSGKSAGTTLNCSTC